MAIPDYPSTLPRPVYGNYAGVVDPGLAITGTPAQRPAVTKTFNSPRVDMSLTFNMDNDTYKTWFAWVKDNAFGWINMPVVSPRTPTDITSTQKVRFTSPIQYQKAGDNWLTVTVAAEMVPGD